LTCDTVRMSPSRPDPTIRCEVVKARDRTRKPRRYRRKVGFREGLRMPLQPALASSP
jgi:hypothetical protein